MGQIRARFGHIGRLDLPWNLLGFVLKWLELECSGMVGVKNEEREASMTETKFLTSLTEHALLPLSYPVFY